MKILQHLTLENLKKNRLRTLVTLIGIMLSVALFTAVTTSVSSLQSYLVRRVIHTEGSWHGAAANLDAQALAELRSQPQVRQLAALRPLGYTAIDGPANVYKPYLYLAAMEPGFTDLMPVHLTRGRLPEMAGEVLVPEHLLANGGVELTLGQLLELAPGDRVSEGEALDMSVPLDPGRPETILPGESGTYRVVGFYQRPAFESYSAPGYTLLTAAPASDQGTHDVWFTLDRPQSVYEFNRTQFPDQRTDLNKDLLRVRGESDDNTMTAVLYGLVAILSGLIMFGSITLIYNAFAISLTERTRQFGLLRSLGATKRQVRQSILLEGLMLSVVGIPLGILLGLAGISVTFHFSRDLFAQLGGLSNTIPLRLEPNGTAIALSAGLSLITILLSAWIPSRRAARISPLEAIRSNQDIRLPKGKITGHQGLARLFGFPGILAAKNFRRDRRKYRATVISLFLSVVLFIAASSFTTYLTGSMRSVLQGDGYDLIFYQVAGQEMPVTQTRDLLESAPGVEGVVCDQSSNYAPLILPAEAINPDYLAWRSRVGALEPIPGVTADGAMIAMHLIFLDDESFRQLLAENGLNESEYMNAASPKALVHDRITLFDQAERRYYPFELLTGSISQAVHLSVKPDYREGYYFGGVMEAGSYVFYPEASGENLSERLLVAPEEVETRQVLQLGARIREMPGIAYNTLGDELKVIYPLSLKAMVTGQAQVETPTRFYLSAPDHQAVYQQLSATLRDEGMDSTQLYDEAAGRQTQRAISTVVQIFSYGFISLISLIAAANVFNTIHTNIGLRRREFAMLRSVGMERGSVRRMMACESLLYGSKSLIWGLPAALVINWIIYRVMRQGMELTFQIPWSSGLIAILSVFAVVAVSTVYAMKQLARESTAQALKNENL